MHDVQHNNSAPCCAVRRRWTADRSCFAAPYGAQCECPFRLLDPPVNGINVSGTLSPFLDRHSEAVSSLVLCWTRLSRQTDVHTLWHIIIWPLLSSDTQRGQDGRTQTSRLDYCNALSHDTSASNLNTFQWAWTFLTSDVQGSTFRYSVTMAASSQMPRSIYWSC